MTMLTVALVPGRPTVASEFSYVLSGDGKSIESHGQATLALLPSADALVLVVAARALSWHQVKLPPLPSGRQRAALDGLLEDRLLDDPAALSLALSPLRQTDGSILVAACDKAWLAAALQLFEQAGRRASRVVPELAPLEAADSDLTLQLVVTGTPEEAWLCVVDSLGVVSVPLAQGRQLLGAEALAADGIHLVAEPAVATIAEQSLGRPAAVRSAAQALLASSQTGWELAQFDLATSGRGRLARRWGAAARQLLSAPRWRALRWGLAAALAANLIGLNAWAWRLDDTLQVRRLQVRQLLTQTFPTVRTVVDAPLQMERELALLRQSSGALSARDLETLLSALGTALPGSAFASSLDFSAGQLTVKGMLLPADQVALLSSKLSGHGYGARLEGDRLILRFTASR